MPEDHVDAFVEKLKRNPHVPESMAERLKQEHMGAKPFRFASSFFIAVAKNSSSSIKPITRRMSRAAEAIT